MSVHVRSKAAGVWTERGHTIATSSIVLLRNNKQLNGVDSVDSVDGEVEGGGGLGNKGEEAEDVPRSNSGGGGQGHKKKQTLKIEESTMEDDDDDYDVWAEDEGVGQQGGNASNDFPVEDFVKDLAYMMENANRGLVMRNNGEM
eukprot:scaffold201572_cov35-Attheya_sp.AAC.3